MSALTGFTVLELAETVSGEYCGKLLSDFGAQIIKIERPEGGSPTRKLGPFADGRPGTERSGLFAYLNTGKQSVALDVNSEAGRSSLQQLLARVDVVVDDHSAEWLHSLALAPASLTESQPALVWCSISNFGLAPPEDRKHSQDLNVFHGSGWGYHTPSGAGAAQTPLKGAGRFLPSYEAGLEAALCINAALFEREDSGLGRVIEISKQQVLASRVDYVLGQMIAGDMPVSTERTALDLGGPAGIFPCKDGYVYLWMSAPGHWDALRQLMDDTAWMDDFPPNWLERECTPERVKTCRHHLTAWLATHNKHEIAASAQQLGLTVVAVNNARDLLESPQFQFREFFTELEHPVMGSIRYPTTPYKMSETPARASAPAPLLGEHTDALSGGTP